MYMLIYDVMIWSRAIMPKNSLLRLTTIEHFKEQDSKMKRPRYIPPIKRHNMWPNEVEIMRSISPKFKGN